MIARRALASRGTSAVAAIGRDDRFSKILVSINGAFDLQKTSKPALYQKVGGSNVPPAIPKSPFRISTCHKTVVPHVLQNLFLKLRPEELLKLYSVKSPFMMFTWLSSK